MDKTAFGFNLSKIIDQDISGNFIINKRNMRLYYPSNYLAKYRYRKCLKDNKLFDLSSTKNLCFEKYNINQIITDMSEKIDEKKYKCDLINTNAASRNIFNRNRITYKYCKKIELSK